MVTVSFQKSTHYYVPFSNHKASHFSPDLTAYMHSLCVAAKSRSQPPTDTGTRHNVNCSLAHHRPSFHCAQHSCCHHLVIVFNEIIAVLAIIICAIITVVIFINWQLRPWLLIIFLFIIITIIAIIIIIVATSQWYVFCSFHLVHVNLFKYFFRLDVMFLSSRSEREGKRNARWPRPQRLHQQQLRRCRYPRAFLRPDLRRPRLLSLQAAVCSASKVSRLATWVLTL